MQSRRLHFILVIAALSWAIGASNVSAAPKVLDQWLPEKPYNFDFGAGKFVAHYRLQLWTDHVRLDGWYYVRVAGKKIIKDDNHSVLNEEFDALPVELNEDWKIGDLGKAGVTLKIESNKAKIKIRGEIKGSKFSLIDAELKY